MALTVLERPEKTLDNGFISAWNASALPLQYTLESDLFPTNTVDSSIAITNVIYDISVNGTVISFGGPSPYSTGEYVLVSGTGIVGLDGIVFSVQQSFSNAIVVNFFTSETSSSGSVIKHYKNYKGLIKVFVGARENHPYNLDGSKPEREIGTIQTDFIDVNGNNEGIVNIRSFVKPDMNADFDTDENSHFAWTAFRIEYAESYDEFINQPTTVTTFEPDDYDNCVPFVGYTNDSFDSGLTDWSQETLVAGGDNDWVAGVGQIDCSLATITGSPLRTKLIYQDVQIIAGNEYQMDVDISFTGVTPPNSLSIDVFSIAGIGFFHGNLVINSDGFYSIFFTPSRDFDNVGVSIENVQVGTDVTITLNSLVVSFNGTIENICNAYGYSIFGAKQFQDNLGGNFGDYVLNIVDEDVTPKLLTEFNELKYFYGKPFYLNSIIPSSTFSLSEDSNNLFVSISLFNESNENILTFDYKIDSFKDGVYTVDPNIKDQLDLNNINPCDWSYGTVRYIIIPSNVLVDFDNGTFENMDPLTWNFTLFTYTPGTPDQVGFFIEDEPFGRGSSACGVISTFSAEMTVSSKQYKVYENNTKMSVIEGRTYEISSYCTTEDGNFQIDQKDNGFFYWLPEGYNIDEVEYNTFELKDSNFFTGVTPEFNDWRLLKTTFVAKADADLSIVFWQGIKTNINVGTGAAIFIDDITFKGPYEFISEEKTIVNSCDCENYELVLRWKNSLGGWEVWNFTARRTEGERTTNIITTQKDLTFDWDNEFINGETQFDTISIDSRPTITVRSQLLNEDEFRNISKIRRSIRVQMLMTSGKWQTVTINPTSFVSFDQGIKTRELTFDISLPKIVIQNQ